MEEIQRKERGFGEKFVELKVANRDIECAEERVRCELREWKKMFGDMKARESMNFKENSCLRGKLACLEVEQTELDHAKRKVEEELIEWKERCGDLRARQLKLYEENSQLRRVEKREKEIREKFLELKAENRDLNRAKQQIEIDALEWKGKNGKLEAELFKLVKENSRLAKIEKVASEYGERFHELEMANKDLGCANARVQEEALEWERKYGELLAQDVALESSRLIHIEKKASEFEDRFHALEAVNRDLLCAKTRTEEEVLEEREKYVALEHSHLVEIERKEMEARNKVTAIEAKNKDIEHEWRRSQDEVHDWKEKYGKLESQILRLVEENSCLTSKLAFENSRLVQVEKKEGKLLAKLVQFEVENKDLEHAKRDAEEEVLVWIKRCKELKAHECKLMEENSHIMQIEKKGREMGEKLVELEMEYRNLECANGRLQDEIHELEVANRDLGCAGSSS